MTPENLLNHLDSGTLWPAHAPDTERPSLDAAYASALAVRALRIARGEQPRGFKIGFTNRTIWPRYNVYAPIWGTVWDSTLQHGESGGESECTVSLAHTCQPRLEPEIVFGMKFTPAPNATLDQLFDSLAWVAPGFEVVQSHLPDWKFDAADTVADSGLHARLVVGQHIPVNELAPDANALDELLAQARVTLYRDQQAVEEGLGSNVLGSPLRALQHFLTTLRACPGAPDLQPGDVVTTGTWTDAWPLRPGEQWQARFSLPGFQLALQTTA
jgi:2-oxo-3-hexenedioate decarboxylase